MKKTAEVLKLGKGLHLEVEKSMTAKSLVVTLLLKSKKKCILHWGVSGEQNGSWQLPPEAIWPTATKAAGPAAVRTPFVAGKAGSQIKIKMVTERDFSVLSFALFFPEENLWDNNNGKNYHIRLPQAGQSLLSPGQALASEIKEKHILFQQSYWFAGRELAAAVVVEDDRYQITLVTDISGPLLLHWGVAKRSRYEWLLPPEHLRPEGTEVLDEKAVQTPFVWTDGLNRLQLSWQESQAMLGMPFVLHKPDTGEWLKTGPGNIFVPVKMAEHEEAVFESAELAEAADEIIQVETGRNSWTLMHRFNLCHDMVDRLGSDVQALALLFVWLRYSAIRQLDWQRNYNTQPRELSHAQQRLTLKLADCYRNSNPASREIIRLILSSVGRGGEGGKGQRIRDDILHIMHRHKIKEVTGHFMEEWHQKLHNNATADDIVICEAYLAFLHSNGDLGAFYSTLEQGGVTKERLENFERPIVTDPDFAHHIKDGLIHDFENYLNLLKSVHSATDLFSAAEAAGHCLDDHLREWVWSLYHSRDDMAMAAEDHVRSITGLRRALNERLDASGDSRCIRDILYLDLALEEFLRVVVERSIHMEFRHEHLVELIGLVLENMSFSHQDEEQASCYGHWQKLQKSASFDREWALHARSVLDRMTGALGRFIDYYYALLQAKAEHLGRAFRAEDWTIELFNQEVIRGSSAYVLSILLRHIDPLLRKTADLGNWQIISQNEAMGRVEVADLYAVQDKKFSSATVIVTDNVKGEEEVPEGVVAVITPVGVDILSHVSVRARNAAILFATCYEPKILDEIKSQQGQNLRLIVTSGGDVEFHREEEQKSPKKGARQKVKIGPVSCRPVAFSRYAVSGKQFTDKLVGGKSLQLRQLVGKLPDWIQVPASAAVPFCVCDRVFSMEQNKPLLKQYGKLKKELESNPRKVLPQLRQTLMKLTAPAQFRSVLQKVMKEEGMSCSPEWDGCWERIKHVWASKWNERAYWSRKKWQIDHDKLHMAVLIQEVVEAEYAFVIHTANPFTNNKDEIYGEVVLGLGETLCSGNYPGRALSFTCGKGKTLKPKIVSYPGKSLAQKGSGLIFRSDSNGEDLEDYAGAGLYDSVLLAPPHEIYPDYLGSPLLWQDDFRMKFLRDVAKIGIETENIMDGEPQDIEGAYRDGQFFVVQTRPQVGV